MSFFNSGSNLCTFHFFNLSLIQNLKNMKEKGIYFKMIEKNFYIIYYFFYHTQENSKYAKENINSQYRKHQYNDKIK